MTFPDLPARLASARASIAEAQARAGWRHPVTIVAVTKTFGVEAVRAAVDAGLGAVGENRVQEALAKQEALTDLVVDWHLIGTLQKNKARQAAGRFSLIHSVDRLDLAVELNRRMPEGAAPQAILVQVNCSGEPQKGGVEPAGLPHLARRAAPARATRGPGPDDAWPNSRPIRRRPARRSRCCEGSAMSRRATGIELPELSMGMSGDFAVAVEEGATMVRLGTILFGGRSA